MRDFSRLRDYLDEMGQSGRKLRLWLRDDDATTPSAPLDRLLGLLSRHEVPALIAAIPARAEPALAQRLAAEPGLRVGVHGWAHVSHSKGRQKNSELGAARPTEVVVGDLVRALERNADLFGPQHIPVLVPPWNRITPRVVARLPGAGFIALSRYKPEKTAPLPLVNTHLDLIDWRGTRRGYADAKLINRLLRFLRRGIDDIGILTHHLDQDEIAWSFLERFIAATNAHPAAEWVSVETLIAERTI